MARLRALPLRHRLFARRRLLSDDTEHACLNAQALARSNGERDSFVRSLAWGLRFWVLSLPAGIGLGTLRALMKQLVGFSPQRSGGGSAGNGPMMRAPVLGLFAADTPDRMRELVGASTRITHQDPRAERAALCVALTTACSAANDQGEPSQLLASLRHEEDAELNEILAAIEVSLGWGEPTSSFAASRGYERGVPGYCYSTLAVVRHAWLSHPSDFEAALTAVVSCGGDTDTTGAILGGIVGAGVGKKGIPAAWLHGLSDWPRSRVWIEALSQQVAYTKLARLARQPVVAPFPFTLIRNLCFMPLVLAHGLRRLFPPYCAPVSARPVSAIVSEIENGVPRSTARDWSRNDSAKCSLPLRLGIASLVCAAGVDHAGESIRPSRNSASERPDQTRCGMWIRA